MFLGCLCLCYSSSQAQVKVGLSNLPEGVVESGSSHTIVVNVEYSGPDTIELRFAQEIPRPLRALVFTRRFEISAGKSKNILNPQLANSPKLFPAAG